MTPPDSLVEVRVLEDDAGVLPAALQGDVLEIGSRRLHDRSPRGGASGEGNLIHVRVLGERLAGGRPEARDDVDDTGRDPGLDDKLAEVQRCERRLLGWLQHDRVTAGERRRNLPG